MLVVGLAVAAGGLAQLSVKPPSPGLAQILRQRDPGARVGGNTIVVVGNGVRIIGVPGRPNFIIALGGHDTIVAGGRDDELGALGANVTIVAGKAGHELIVGGPGGRIFVGGAGHDLVIETKPDATIVVSSSADRIVDSGRNDRVECVGKWFRDAIYAGATDKVDASCARHHDKVLPVSGHHPLKQPLRLTQAATVTGSGTNLDPYMAPCDGSGSTPSCVVSSFASRSLTGFWANEFVPAYRCPGDHPYLLNANYALAGTSLPNGVEVEGLGPIGVSIAGTATVTGVAVGTLTGGQLSSATNWTTGAASYRIVLHCTSDLSASYHA